MPLEGRMPRPPDPDLENRILNAAQKLWKKEGAKALTMRAVARAAGTNTPAVYRRFHDRRAIVRALLRRTQHEVGDALQRCRSFEAVAAAYLEYALKHPHEYELFYQHVDVLSGPDHSGRVPSLKELQPNFALIKRKLSEQLGGTPEDHGRRALALWAMAHGTALLVLSKAISTRQAAALRSVYTAAVGAMLRDPFISSIRKAK